MAPRLSVRSGIGYRTILSVTPDVAIQKSGRQIESSVFFLSNQYFGFEIILTAQLHGFVFLAFLIYVDKRLDDSMYCGFVNRFSRIPVHVNRNMTIALNKVNCFLWAKVPILLSVQSFDFSTICKLIFLRVSIDFEFSTPGCQKFFQGC